MNSAIPSFLFICWPLFSFAEYDSQRNHRRGNDIDNFANSSDDGWYPENVDSDEKVRSDNASDFSTNDFKNGIPSEHVRNDPRTRYSANGIVYTSPSYPVRQLIRVESRPIVGQPLKPYPVAVYKAVPYEVRGPYKKRIIFEKRVPVPVHPLRIVPHPVQIAAVPSELKVPTFSRPQFVKPSLFGYENDAKINQPPVNSVHPAQNNQNFDSINLYRKLPVNKPALNYPKYNGVRDSRRPPPQINYQELLLRPLQETAARYLPQMNDIFDRPHPSDTRFPPRIDLSAQQSSATPSLPSPTPSSSTEETPQLPIEEYFRLNTNATFHDGQKPDVSNYNLHEFSIDNPNSLSHVHNLTEFHVGSTKHYSSPFDLFKSFKFKYKQIGRAHV